MSVSEWQCRELRRLADKLGNEKKVSVPFVRVLVIPIMREAANTIERLRYRLQDFEDARYNDGFSNGVKACLQQLDGLILEGTDVDEIQAWVDEQWEEEA